MQSDDEEELRKRGYLLGKTLGEGSYAKVSEKWISMHGCYNFRGATKTRGFSYEEIFKYHRKT